MNKKKCKKNRIKTVFYLRKIYRVDDEYYLCLRCGSAEDEYFVYEWFRRYYYDIFVLAIRGEKKTASTAETTIIFGKIDLRSILRTAVD